MFRCRPTVHFNCSDQLAFSLRTSGETTRTPLARDDGVVFPVSVSSSIVCSLRSLIEGNSIGYHDSLSFLHSFFLVISPRVQMHTVLLTIYRLKPVIYGSFGCIP